MYLCAALTVVIALLIFCVPPLARSVPINYILLFSFTLFESYSVSAITSVYRSDVVVAAAAITLAVTLGLTLYAFKTKSDFTMLGSFLFALTLGLIVFGIMVAIFPSQIAILLYSLLGALIFSVYIVYDT